MFCIHFLLDLTITLLLCAQKYDHLLCSLFATVGIHFRPNSIGDVSFSFRILGLPDKIFATLCFQIRPIYTCSMNVFISGFEDDHWPRYLLFWTF